MKKQESLRETQGHRKLKQYIEDLRKNNIFIKKTERIEKLLRYAGKLKAESPGVPINKNRNEALLAYEAYVKKFNDYAKKRAGSISAGKLSERMADEYGVNFDVIMRIIFEESFSKSGVNFSDNLDMCAISSDYEKLIKNDFPNIPQKMDFEQRCHYTAYPVSLNINKLASKRDVIDFINKNWHIIESGLESHRGKKKARFRERKIDRKISDFIWEYRKEPIKEIKKQLDREFPKNGLVYYQINKIINLELSRRNGELTWINKS